MANSKYWKHISGRNGTKGRIEVLKSAADKENVNWDYIYGMAKALDCDIITVSKLTGKKKEPTYKEFRDMLDKAIVKKVPEAKEVYEMYYSVASKENGSGHAGAMNRLKKELPEALAAVEKWAKEQIKPEDQPKETK